MGTPEGIRLAVAHHWSQSFTSIVRFVYFCLLIAVKDNVLKENISKKAKESARTENKRFRF